MQQGEFAFRLLVDANKDRLYNTIFGFITNTEDAEDVLQEVFIAVFENIGSLKSQSLLTTWMYRIAVTQSLDAIRRKSRKKRAATFLSWVGVREDHEKYAVETVHPGLLAENREQSLVLFKAIQRLPENQRAAFVLQKIEGMNQQDIAAVLKTSTGAVESLLSSSKQNLRKNTYKLLS